MADDPVRKITNGYSAFIQEATLAYRELTEKAGDQLKKAAATFELLVGGMVMMDQSTYEELIKLQARINELMSKSAPLPTTKPTGHPLGEPTYPKPGLGYQWMGSYDPSGTWREAWVFVGAAAGDGAPMTPMQYAQSLGLTPQAWMGTASRDDIYNFAKAQGLVK